MDKPTSVAAPIRTIPSYCHTIVNASGLDDSATLAYTPGGADPFVPGLASSTMDEMALTTLASTPSLLSTNSFSASFAPGDIVASFPVNPRWLSQRFPGASVAPDSVFPSPLSAATTPFTYWRGTMRYHFTVVCSSFHTCRLGIVFAPGATDPDLVSGMIRYVDVQGPTTFTVAVPFTHARAYAAGSIGHLVVFTAVPPTEVSSVAPSTLTLVTFVAGSSDFQLYGPRDSYYLPVSSATIAEFVPAALPRQDFLADFDPIVAGARSVVVPPVHFADAFDHVADLAMLPYRVATKFKVPAAGLSLCANATSAGNYYGTATLDSTRVVNEGDPDAPTAITVGQWTLSPGSAASGYAAGVGTRLFIGPVEHFAEAYRFARGAMRFKLEAFGSYAFDVRPVTSALGGNLWHSAKGVSPVCVGDGWDPSSESCHTLPVDYNDGATHLVEFESPTAGSALFYVTSRPAVTPVVGGYALPYDEGVRRFVALTNSSNTTGDVISSLRRSVGDGFRFYFIKGLKQSYLYSRGTLVSYSADPETYATVL